MMPEEKAAILRSYKERTERYFVGDGVNDSPS